MSGTDSLGIVAGSITALTFLPQVIKTWKEKSAKNISLWMFLIAFVNEILWTAYGFLLHNHVIIITNLVMLLMSGIMIYFKLTYKEPTA